MRWNSSYIVRTATPPKLGKCDVNPTEGVFLQDKFSVNCSGFGDNSAPLTYMFYIDPGNNTASIHGEIVKRNFGRHNKQRFKIDFSNN